MESYTTSMWPGWVTGSPSSGACSTAPDHSASSSTNESRGSWAKTADAPKRNAISRWASKRATTPTSTPG